MKILRYDIRLACLCTCHISVLRDAPENLHKTLQLLLPATCFQTKKGKTKYSEGMKVLFWEMFRHCKALRFSRAFNRVLTVGGRGR